MGSLKRLVRQTIFQDISAKTERRKHKHMMWEMRKIEQKWKIKEFPVEFYAKMLSLNEKENGK